MGAEIFSKSLHACVGVKNTKSKMVTTQGTRKRGALGLGRGARGPATASSVFCFFKNMYVKKIQENAKICQSWVMGTMVF